MLAGLGPMADPVRVARLVNTSSLSAPIPASFATLVFIQLPWAPQRYTRAICALPHHHRRLAAMPSATVRATAVTTGKMQMSVMPVRRDLTVQPKTA